MVVEVGIPKPVNPQNRNVIHIKAPFTPVCGQSWGKDGEKTINPLKTNTQERIGSTTKDLEKIYFPHIPLSDGPEDTVFPMWMKAENALWERGEVF